MSPTIGQLQKFKDGETIFNDFMTMRAKHLTELQKLLSSFSDAHRYYAEGQLFFVFEKQIIETLLMRLKDNDIVVLYPGMRDDGKPGRPTLVVCPYKKVGNNFEFVPSTDGKSDVAEHSGLTAATTPSGPFKIPTTIPASDIDPKFQISLE